MRIIDESRCFWTENKKDKTGYWSNFSKLSYEKRDFFILKAIILILFMKVSGVDAHLTNEIAWELKSESHE